MTGPDFDWSRNSESAECIVVHSQASVAVYTNPQGAIVIRQEDCYGDTENDPFVFIARAHVPVVALAMLRAAGLVADKPLRPQIAAMLLPQPQEAAETFEALDAELTEADGQQSMFTANGAGA